MTAETESLGSLLRRLGTPPPDLAEHLTHQFQLACTAIIDSGGSIHTVDLDDWCISDQGKLVLAVSAKSNAVARDSGAAVDLPGLIARFRECLAVEMKGAKSPVLAPAEAEDRNKLIELFGASLADRFGSDVIEQPSGPISQPDSVKLISMERDLRFNWNRVLAAGAVAVVLVVALIGTKVVQNRKRRAAIAVSATNRSPDEPSKIDVSPSILDRNSPVTEQLGIAEELESIDVESMWSGAHLFASAVASEETLALGLPLDVKMDFRPRNLVKSGSEQPQIVGSPLDPGAPDPLDPILDDDDEIPESPQQSRTKETQFWQLLATNVTDHAIDLAGSMERIERVEFPINVPIKVTRQGDEMPAFLVNTKSGAKIATITRNDAVNRLQWTDQARLERTSTRLIHGRLVDANNGALYLRPSIETDPFLLSFSRKDCRPTWDLGGDILPIVTQLEIGLSVPESIDLAWIRPFNPTRLKKGTAVAVLTPKDGETIAIQVRFHVKCTQKLTCIIGYWARLDPTMAWGEISRQGLENAIGLNSRILASEEVHLASSERSYEQANSTIRELMRPKLSYLKMRIKKLKAAHERLALLSILLDQVESSVALELHLYVNWPDVQQTILRVTDGKPLRQRQPLPSEEIVQL